MLNPSVIVESKEVTRIILAFRRQIREVIPTQKMRIESDYQYNPNPEKIRIPIGEKSPEQITLENNNNPDTVPFELKSKVYHMENRIESDGIKNEKTRYKNWKKIPLTPIFPIKYPAVENIGKYEIPFNPSTSYEKIKEEKNKTPIETYSQKVQKIQERFNKYLSKKNQWNLFNKLFSKYPINSEDISDPRVLFVVNFISKIRAGIKVKTIATNGKKLEKSKGYNTNHFHKNWDTAKDSIQMAYYSSILKGKPMSAYYCMLGALKQMTREKKYNRKIDIMGWKKYRSQVWESMKIAEKEEKIISPKWDKLEQLKIKLANFVPTNKSEKIWQKIWELFLCQGLSKKKIRLELNLSKSWFCDLMKKIPAEFADYKLELESACQKVYKK